MRKYSAHHNTDVNTGSVGGLLILILCILWPQFNATRYTELPVVYGEFRHFVHILCICSKHCFYIQEDVYRFGAPALLEKGRFPLLDSVARLLNAH